MEKLNLWHSSDVDEKKKINEIIDEIEKIKAVIGLNVDSSEDL